MKVARKLRKMFRSGNDAKVRAAFCAIKADMHELEYGQRSLDAHHEGLKRSTNDWIIHLQQENHDLRTRIDYLESRLASMRRRKEEDESLAFLDSV